MINNQTIVLRQTFAIMEIVYQKLMDTDANAEQAGGGSSATYQLTSASTMDA